MLLELTKKDILAIVNGTLQMGGGTGFLNLNSLSQRNAVIFTNVLGR